MSSRNVLALKLGASRILKSCFLLFGVVLLATTTGCVGAPWQLEPVVIAPQPVYVAPNYASPGIGWAWVFHPTHGWGWHHAEHGWDRGWR